MIDIKRVSIFVFVALSIFAPFYIIFQRRTSKEVILNVYNCGEFMALGDNGSVNINDLFTKRTGIKVNYTTFQSNEEMLAKILGGGAEYDVIFPSEYVTEKLIKQDMLEKIDLNNIPNSKFICDELKNLAFDPKNEYSLPYMWGVLGIFYNQNYVKDKISWKILWDKKYAKKILMCDNVRDTFSIALFKNHKSVNSTDPKDWILAYEEVKAQRPLVQSYMGDQIFDKLIGEEAYLAPFYYGHSPQNNILDGYDNIKFAVPEEGTNKFVDCVCILKGSKHKKEAEMYMNFLYENDISYENSKAIGYLSPNKNVFNNCFKEGTAYLKEYDTKKTCLYEDLPEEISKMNDDLWIKVKTGEQNEDDEFDFNSLILILVFSIVIIAYILILIKKIKVRFKPRRCSLK